MARILIVDDDDFRRVVRRILEGEDMPRTDGIEAPIRLKQEFPDARVIAASGGGYIDHAEILTMASRLGAPRTLTKPVARKDLLEVVNAVWDQDG